MDVADSMLELARGLHPEIEFRQGDAEALTFADATFDAAVANFLLCDPGAPSGPPGSSPACSCRAGGSH